MRGSDIDILGVLKWIDIYEDTHIDFNTDTIHFTMEPERYTAKGFTKLHLVHSNCTDIIKDCIKIGSDFYFTNLLFKHGIFTEDFSILHGPCVTTKLGFCDLAISLHSKLWITPAKQWITLSNE